MGSPSLATRNRLSHLAELGATSSSLLSLNPPRPELSPKGPCSPFRQEICLNGLSLGCVCDGVEKPVPAGSQAPFRVSVASEGHLTTQCLFWAFAALAALPTCCSQSTLAGRSPLTQALLSWPFWGPAVGASEKRGEEGAEFPGKVLLSLLGIMDAMPQETGLLLMSRDWHSLPP